MNCKNSWFLHALNLTCSETAKHGPVSGSSARPSSYSFNLEAPGHATWAGFSPVRAVKCSSCDAAMSYEIALLRQPQPFQNDTLQAGQFHNCTHPLCCQAVAHELQLPEAGEAGSGGEGVGECERTPVPATEVERGKGGVRETVGGEGREGEIKGVNVLERLLT